MNAKILIVEDEAIIADDLQQLLEGLGYQTFDPVDNAADALRVARAAPPDLALIDIRIKGEVDGIALAAALKDALPLSVIFLTAHSDEPTLQRAGQVNPAGYLLKPFNARELRAAIEIALRRHVQEVDLIARERWFATTLHSIGDAVIATDPQGKLIFMNPIAEQLLGWHLSEVIGRPVEQVLRLIDQQGQPINSPAHRALAQGLVVQLETDARVVTRGGATRDVDDSAAPIRDESGALLGAVVVFRDVTDARLMERRLVQSERLAAVGTLAAGMVHEINNPLSYVLASVEMARTRLAVMLDRPTIFDPSDRAALDGIAELLGEAEHGALRVRDLVRDLRRFSSAEGAASDLIDLHAVIDEAIRLTEPQVRPVGALRRAYGTIPYVFGHAGQLSQVFVNLIINAAHALHAVRGGAITITTATDDAHNAMISVHDDGCGIPPEHLPRVFDPFFSTHSGELGMGLGLSISLNICRDHQGDLSVESAQGQGTTFTVTLPAADPATSHAADASQRRPGGRSAHSTPTPRGPKTPRARILVIDDEPQVTRALTRMLQDHHDVFALHSAQDALVEVLAGERFDVLLCDLLMPDMTGMDLYAKLLAYNPAQARRTLFMTGGAFTNEAAAFLDRYPSRVIQKPFSVNDLLALIETIREQ